MILLVINISVWSGPVLNGIYLGVVLVECSSTSGFGFPKVCKILINSGNEVEGWLRYYKTSSAYNTILCCLAFIVIPL